MPSKHVMLFHPFFKYIVSNLSHLVFGFSRYLLLFGWDRTNDGIFFMYPGSASSKIFLSALVDIVFLLLVGTATKLHIVYIIHQHLLWHHW